MAVVRQDLKKFADEGLIDEGVVIKTILWCNDKLGITVRDIREVVLPVKNYRAALPLDLEKLYYTCKVTRPEDIVATLVNPLDNSFDGDIVYEATMEKSLIGRVEHRTLTIQRATTEEVLKSEYFTELSVVPSPLCDPRSPNLGGKGSDLTIDADGNIHTHFAEGELYLMYIGAMKDKEGNILFPFHPLITPWYEWAVKEKIIMDAIFNSDGDFSNLLKLAQGEKSKAWLDALNITLTPTYKELKDLQHRKEQKWFNQYFSLFQ